MRILNEPGILLVAIFKKFQPRLPRPPAEWRPKQTGQVPPALFEDTFCVAQVFEALSTVIGARSALANATERHIVLSVVQERVVDRDVARRRALKHLAAIFAVASEVVERQWKPDY